MKPKEPENYKSTNARNHSESSLFSEWPAPSDVVAGFGGNQNNADPKQWKLKKGTPNSE